MFVFLVEDGFVFGCLEDELGKFNLNVLVKLDKKLNEVVKFWFEKLLVCVGLFV